MNNQAAQTMPLPEPEVLLHSPTHGHVYGYTTEQMRAYGDAREAAALSQPAGVVEGWTREDLQDLYDRLVSAGISKFMEGSSNKAADRQFVGRAVTQAWLLIGEMLAAAPAASGGERTIQQRGLADPNPYKASESPLLTNPEWGVQLNLPSGASVGERAREALAWAAYGTSDEFGPVMLPDYVGTMDVIRKRVMEDARREGFNGHFVERMANLGWWVEPLFHAPAIEHALSSPRQEGKEVAWNIPCGACDCGIYDAQALAAFNGEIPKCKNHDRQCVGAVHAMQATHPSAAASTQGLREYITRLKEAHKHAATYSLTEYEKGWTRRGKVIADELESLLTSPTTGADGVNDGR